MLLWLWRGLQSPVADGQAGWHEKGAQPLRSDREVSFRGEWHVMDLIPGDATIWPQFSPA